MKKYLLTLITALVCMLLFAVCVSAETYTVSSDDEYEAAYAKAVGGDTIVVTDKLTSDIYANKSITYVLKADWESDKLVINQSNVEVSFIADGGDYKIMPTNYSTTDGWMNISAIYENIVINLGGMNGGTLTIDGTNATHDRVSYVPALVEKIQYDSAVFPDICLNLLSGSAVANFNTSTEDDNVNASILYAKTVNMYDGCQIYGNSVISAPLFKSCYFNMYGGEIFGNLLTSTRFEKTGVGFIYADRQFVMYDGKISKNIFKAIHSTNYSFNVAGFISTNQKYYGSKGTAVLGGEVGDRYVSGTGNNEISAVFGVYVKDNGQTPIYYNTGITVGTRYKFTDTPQLTLDQETGKTIWKVSTFSTNTSDISENNYGFCWNSARKSGDKVAVFLNAQKKPIASNNFDTYTIINAYIDGVYSTSGSTTIAIPSGYDLWSTSGTEYCHTGRAYTLSEVTSANIITLYSAYEAERVTINGTKVCSGCGEVFSCNNPDHDQEIISIIYESYEKEGIKTVRCNECDVVSTYTAPALFESLGYSAPDDGTNGIALGYTADRVAIKEYESATGNTINFGAFATLKDRIGNQPIFKEDGTPSAGVIHAEISDYKFSAYSIKIVGFKDNNKDTKFALGTYIATKSGETTEYTYLQSGTANANERYHFVSYNDIVSSIPDEIVELEDIVLQAGEEVTLPSTVNVNGKNKKVTYSFEGESISIENNVLKGIVKGSETIVTVKGEKVSGTFKVKVNADYKYVVVIGVDGAGSFFRNADTPNIDTIFANGATTYDCLTADPTISAQCWGSLLHGVTPSVHGLTNSVVSSTAYPSDSKYPSFFRVIRENDENAILASFCNWNPINVGIIENNIDAYKVGGISDSNLTDEIIKYLGSNNPTALFVQFDEADGAGHSYGYGSASQLAKISEIDGYIGRIYDAYEQNGILDETLFIVTSDHGGAGTSHGGLSDAEKYVMFAATGQNVQNGTIGDMEIRDTAAIVLYALGYECPETWTARVPSGLFEGVTAGDRPVYVDKESGRYHETEPTPEVGSDGYVTNYITDHELNTYLTFDGDITDNCNGSTTQGGKLYFVEDGYFGNGVSLDDGYVTLENFTPGEDSYTFALWINTKAISSDPCIFSNQNWDSGKNLGYTLTIRASGVSLKLGNGGADIQCTAALPTDYTEGWMHVLAFIDRTNNKIGVCVDFGTIVTVDIPEAFRISLDTAYTANIGQDGRGYYNVPLPATVDEFMIFEGAFDQADVEALKNYYGLVSE